MLSYEIKSLLSESVLFTGLSDAEFSDALEYFSVYAKSYKENEMIKNIGTAFSQFGIVLSGSVTVYMTNSSGENILMAKVGIGEAFGEALSYLNCNAENEISVIADRETLVAWLSAEKLKSPSFNTNAKYSLFISRYIAMLSEKMLSMNDRIQILSKTTIREKIKAYLLQQQKKNRSDTFDIPFSRNELAGYMGADRCALSRELSKMKKEGLLDYYKSTFKLKKL